VLVRSRVLSGHKTIDGSKYIYGLIKGVQGSIAGQEGNGYY
jgi:hypothetical protein